MTAKKEESSRSSSIGITSFQVWLEGIYAFMFDRYAGNNKTSLRPEEKLYRNSSGGLYVPALNVLSLLSAKNTTSAPKRFMDNRKYKDMCDAILSYVTIEPFEIPLLRNDEQIMFDGTFDANGRNEAAGMYLHYAVARLEKGIPNPKERPVIMLPWSLRFTLSLMNNSEVAASEIKTFLIQGGAAIGLGTWRGLFGKFRVAGWTQI